MKRQRVRNGLLLLSFLLFPVTQFYFSPYLIIMGASEGIINGSFILFSIFLFGGLFFSRAFCGWLMPCGSLQELCMNVNDKKAKGGKLNLIKYFIWIPWLLIIAGAVIQYGGFKTVNPFYQTNNGLSLTEPHTYIIYYGVIILIVTLSLTLGRRASCHYICWMSPFMIVGRKIRNILRLPALQLVTSSANCVSCKKCDKSCPMSLEVSSMVEKGDMENTECILCGKCIDVCNANVIKYSFGCPRTNKAISDNKKEQI